MDIELIEQQIQGLIEKGKGLREKEKVFLKNAGIAESIEKYKQEVITLQSDIETKKEELAELKAQKADVVRDTLIGMQNKITELLPMGDGIVHINDDGSFVHGWMLPNKPFVPYAGLSTGQKRIFEQAFGSALLGDAKEKLLIYEAAEIEGYNSLPALLKQIEKMQGDAQVIVNTWFKPESIPKGWNLIELEG